MRFEYAQSAKEFGPMFQFFRKYVADIRYHNPQLNIWRNKSENGPLVGRIVLVRKSGQG